MIPMSELRGQLVGYLKELHLPTVRACFEEMALKAQRGSLGYAPYLLEVAARECGVRRRKRIQKLLRESRLPLEKSLEEFDLNRLPRKVVNQVQTLRTGSFLARRGISWSSGTPAAVKPTWPALWDRNWSVMGIGFILATAIFSSRNSCGPNRS